MEKIGGVALLLLRGGGKIVAREKVAGRPE